MDKLKEEREKIGLGDVVHKVTKKLRIRECGGCKKRREVLNKFRFPKFKI